MSRALGGMLLLLVTCCSGGGSSGSSGGSAGAGASGGSAGASGSSGASGDSGTGGGPECPGPGYPAVGTPQQVDELTARIVDLEGNPAANLQSTVCGLDICVYGSTNDQGEVVTCDERLGVCSPGIHPQQTIKAPAFKFALGLDYVKWAIPLPAGATHALGDVTTAKLPAASSGVEMLPGTTASSNGISLTVPEGGSVKVDVLTYEAAEHRRFRAVSIPPNQVPAVASNPGFEIVIGATPVDTHFCPPARLEVPNSAGWAPGTEVEFWVHGVDLNAEWAPYAGWAKVSEGVVSSDGSAVVTVASGGVPVLSVFGIKTK